MIDPVTILTMSELRPALRLLTFLRRAPAVPEQNSGDDLIFLTTKDSGTIAVDIAILSKLLRAGYIQHGHSGIGLCDNGHQALQQLKQQHNALPPSAAETYQNNIELSSAKAGGGTVMVNSAESPLAMLYRKNRKTGRRFLSDAEFQAGERLRLDFTRGNMTPRITANWDAAAVKRAYAECGRGTELSANVLDCRKRVETALKNVGPELSGVLVDICCFLKGLEQVERERTWPARSAKMLLKAGLGALHRHYTAGSRMDKENCPPCLHWGTPDYRPSC